MRSCSHGSSGKTMPRSLLMMRLKVSARVLRSSARRSVSSVTPLRRLSRSISCSNRSPGISNTILPNICTNRLKASRPNRSLLVSRMSPSRVSRFSPKLSTVSIIPGMLNLAPERTDTSSGFAGSPNRLPVCSSTVCMRARTSSINPSGTVRPVFMYCTQAVVVIVNPGGTGSPTRLISARPAPFPPSTSRMEALPSSKSIVHVNSVRGIPEVFAMIIPRSPLGFGVGPDGPLSC